MINLAQSHEHEQAPLPPKASPAFKYPILSADMAIRNSAQWGRFMEFSIANEIDSAQLIDWWIKEGISELFSNPDFMKWVMDAYRAKRQ